MIRLVIRGGARGTEPDMPRRRRKSTQNRDRIHASRVLVAAANSDFLVVAKPVGNRQPVGEEDQVKLSAIERACDIDIVVGAEEWNLMGWVSP